MDNNKKILELIGKLAKLYWPNHTIEIKQLLLECENIIGIKHKEIETYDIDELFKDVFLQLEKSFEGEDLQQFHNHIPERFLKYLDNDEYKESRLEEIRSNYDKFENGHYYGDIIEFVASFKNNDIKKSFYDKYFEKIYESERAKLLASFDNDKDKIDRIGIFEDEEDLVQIICSIENDNFKRDLMENYIESNSSKNKIILTFKDDQIKMEYIHNPSKQVKIVLSLSEDTNKLKYYEQLDNKNKANLVASLKDINLRKKYLEELGTEYSGVGNIVETLESEEDQLEALKFLKDSSKLKIIRKFSEQNQIKALSQNQSAYLSERIRKKGNLQSTTIANNISLFVSSEVSEEKSESILPLVQAIFMENTDAGKDIDFKLLDSKYVDTLGLDKIKVIASFKEIQDEIFTLDEKQYEAFYRVIDNYVENTNNLDWAQVAYQILNGFHYKKYDKLVEDIQDFDQINIDNLTRIFLNTNELKIDKAEDIENFEKILQAKCDEEIQSDNINEKKFALINKMFGIGHRASLLDDCSGSYRKNHLYLLNAYGQDIDQIEDCPMKDLIKTIQTIDEMDDPNIIEEIYQQVDFGNIDIYEIEAELKKQYVKLYNKVLLDPQDLPQNEDGLYEAGTDFCIITTSVGAYIQNDIENYKEDWNRPSLASQHFCTNFIRNDMLGRAPIPHISYGFSNMAEDSLVLAGANDIYSSGKSMVSTSAVDNELLYCAPDTLINSTNDIGQYQYNEMDFRRIQNGEKKNPDYIIVYRENGEISNLEEAKKASVQWDNLPIVVIDVDKCLEAEKEKVQTLEEQYAQTGDIKYLQSLRQKIRNNRITDKNFESQYDLDEIDEEIKKENNHKIKLEDLSEIDKQISAEDREKTIKEFKMQYEKLQKDLKLETHGEGER